MRPLILLSNFKIDNIASNIPPIMYALPNITFFIMFSPSIYI